MKVKKHFFGAVLFLFTIALVACKNDYKPEESYIKVYDHSDMNRTFFPISIKGTSDNGYMILSAYNNSGIHVLKTNETGDILWEYDLPSQYNNAVPNLIERNGDLFFVCMDAVGLFAYVMQIDQVAQDASVFEVFPDLLYPLYVADNESSVFIQNYERETFETGVYKLSADLNQILDSVRLDIFIDVEGEVTEHVNYTGKRFPFFVSVTPEEDHIVFNGFNNYSFSTVFLDANLDFSGVYSGAAFDGGMSAILPLGADKFSLTRFSFSDVYMNPGAMLSPTAVDISEGIPSEWKSELDAESPILIKNITIKSVEYVAFLATTKSNQLVLMLYESGSEELAGSRYLGESVPLKACDFSITEDGGLMMLTQATVMSSFNRIATIKLSKEELESLVQ